MQAGRIDTTRPDSGMYISDGTEESSEGRHIRDRDTSAYAYADRVRHGRVLSVIKSVTYYFSGTYI